MAALAQVLKEGDPKRRAKRVTRRVRRIETGGIRPHVVTFPDMYPWSGNASKPTIYRWIREGRWPLPIKLSDGTSAWVVAELDALIDQRIAERNAKIAENSKVEAKRLTKAAKNSTPISKAKARKQRKSDRRAAQRPAIAEVAP